MTKTVKTTARKVKAAPAKKTSHAAAERARLDAIVARTAKANATKAAKAKAEKATKAEVDPAAQYERDTFVPHPSKDATAKAKAAATAKPALTGSKATIADMMRRKNGATEAEVCKKLGWQAAGATISRVIKLLPAGSVTKTKGDDGKTRYIAA